MQTYKMREMASHQSTAWLCLCLADWRREDCRNPKSEVTFARIKAVIRAELRKRGV